MVRLTDAEIAQVAKAFNGNASLELKIKAVVTVVAAINELKSSDS